MGGILAAVALEGAAVRGQVCRFFDNLGRNIATVFAHIIGVEVSCWWGLDESEAPRPHPMPTDTPGASNPGAVADFGEGQTYARGKDIIVLCSRSPPWREAGVDVETVWPGSEGGDRGGKAVMNSLQN